MSESAEKVAPEWMERRRVERAFLETEIGKLFHRFENAHGRAWAADSQDGVSDKRLRETWEAANAARRALINALIAKTL